MLSAIEKELCRRIKSLLSHLDPQPGELPPSIRQQEGIRAVLFDIYGTLFISGAGDIGTTRLKEDRPSFFSALKELALPGELEKAAKEGSRLRREVIRRQHRIRRKEGILFPEVDILEIWKEVFAILEKRHLIEVGVNADQLRRFAVEFECRTNPVWPMPGCREVLDGLRERGYKLGLVSNAQFYTPLLFPTFFNAPLNELGIEPRLCQWSYRIGEAKPSRRLFDNVLDILRDSYGIPPERVLYLGNDMLNDIWGADQVGCKTVLFAGDRRSLKLRKNHSKCRSLKPGAVITRLDMLLEILKSGSNLDY